ncbi:MOG interacting and ectopic P-granules protein 1, partial [Stegodyphus mimosarum]
MSCKESEEKLSEPQVIKIDTVGEKSVISGKPCIDFQPDDRWQIKEDDKQDEKVLPNSKIKSIKNNSSERRSLRLRSSKSTDSSSAVNGETVESGSDDEVHDQNGSKQEENSNDAEGVDKLENLHSRGKRKRLSLESATENSKDVTQKKMKVSDTENFIENEKHSIEVESEQDQKENTDDSNDKVVMPNLTPVATNCEPSNATDNDIDSQSSETKVASDDSKKDANSCSKAVEQAETNDVLPKLEEFKITETNDKGRKQLMGKESPEVIQDSEIEIINIDEGKKSDNSDESDSEIQIINLDDNVKKEKEDLLIVNHATNEDVSLTAGYPYYNSLKEKISGFKAGEYKPVKFPHTGTLLLAENEVIIESPSLLVPLLIKEADEFPKLEGEDKKANGEESAMMRPNVISKRNFFQSSVGQFLINMGMSRVQEWYHRDMKRAKLKQLKASNEQDEGLEKLVEEHEKRHAELKEINAVFNFRMRKCKFCNFKSESQAVMEGHYLTPHLSPRREYRCSFCVFMTRDPEAIIFHFEAMHGKKAVLDVNIPFHECIFCSFQSHLKTKVNAHMNRCRKHFIPSQNLAPPFDFEFPGVTTKPVTIADVIGHRRLLLSSSKNQRLSVPEDSSAYARKKLQSVLSKLSGQNAYTDMKNPSLMKQLMTSQSQMPALSGSGIQLPPGIVITRPRGPQMPQMRPVNRYPQPRAMANYRGPPPRRGPPYTTNISSTASQLASSGISITPVTRAGALPSRNNSMSGMKNVTLTPISTASNRTVSQKPGPPQPVALFTNMAGSGGMMGQPQARLPSVGVNLRPLRPALPYQRLNTPPSQVVKGSSGNTFVMCEICDSYIKDLEELRSHMNWVHKVKIHPKMLVSRPPLNCQKCQWRFFTDQGLERHLLGAHGLVTTNMQEMANKNQDGGRCIICGAVFTYKLVSHMTQVHKVTLKPAHLSYKCTVCTATFTLYRLFESHVYNVHSGSAKRPAEDSSSSPSSSEPLAKKSVPDDTGPRKCKECGFVTETMQEHLIKMHMKSCSVKLCRIEKCEKCLYSSDEMLVIRMSDFGLDDDLDDSGDDSSSESSEDDGDDDSNEQKVATKTEDLQEGQTNEETSITTDSVSVKKEKKGDTEIKSEVVENNHDDVKNSEATSHVKDEETAVCD